MVPPSLILSPGQPPNYSLSLWVYLLGTFHRNGAIECVFLFDFYAVLSLYSLILFKIELQFPPLQPHM